MYGFTPSDEQKMLVETVSRYARNELRTSASAAEEGGEFPEHVVQKGWELGVLQGSVPEAYGGFGERSVVTGVLAAESLAWGDLAGALAVLTPALFVTPLLLGGSEAQKQQWVRPVVAGRWRPVTAALIEASFDFDPNELRTQAKGVEGGYVLEGQKTWVPFAAQAETMIVYASLEGRTQGFIVDRAAPGLEVSSERDRLMSLNALPLYDVTLRAVHVPLARRLGGADGHEFPAILAANRMAQAALALGVAQAAFEYARDYAKEREAFGVKIAQKQAIAFMLAEMATEIEALRVLTWEAAWKLDTGREDAWTACYLAWTGTADMVMMVTDRAVQILGGHGYIRDHPVEMWMRNGRSFAASTGLAIV